MEQTACDTLLANTEWVAVLLMLSKDDDKINKYVCGE